MGFVVMNITTISIAGCVNHVPAILSLDLVNNYYYYSNEEV